MKWLPDGATAFTREDKRYTVNRAPQAGWPATYTLVDRHAEGSRIIHVERGIEQPEHRAAWARLMEQCDA